MKIAVVHNAVSENAPLDETDVQVQVQAVSLALTSLGHDCFPIPCDLDLSHVKTTLATLKPHLVFNLVEGLDGHDRLIHLFPSLLDALHLSHTGSSSTTLFITSNKLLAKGHMQAQGIPTPAWVAWPASSRGTANPWPEECHSSEKWLIKSVWDHASVGLDESALVENKTQRAIEALLEKKTHETGKEWFAERYIHGREFNLSIIASPHGPMILPPAEMVFSKYFDNKPRILGYQAKWDTGSDEYQETVRSFDFSPKDAPLLENLKKAALACWHAFDLSGYARVDFRVDSMDRVWVLEINANPCLSPDAGFPAALNRGGMSYDEGIDRIIQSESFRTMERQARHSKITSATEPLMTRKIPEPALVFRYETVPEDMGGVEDITRATGFFREDEIQIAVELVEERLRKGLESGYFFVFGAIDQKVAGYTCYGPVPCTLTSYDLYWIAVDPKCQNQGIGKRLLDESEKLIRQSGGARVYIETSHKDQYASTRSFYTRCGYTLVSLLEDFYGPGDAKATYCKVL